jgi:hypothetical protein
MGYGGEDIKNAERVIVEAEGMTWFFCFDS